MPGTAARLPVLSTAVAGAALTPAATHSHAQPRMGRRDDHGGGHQQLRRRRGGPPTGPVQGVKGKELQALVTRSAPWPLGGAGGLHWRIYE